MTKKNQYLSPSACVLYVVLVMLTGCAPQNSQSSPPPVGKIYTPDQLNQMAASGSYPQQYPPTSTVKSMEFRECRSKVNDSVDAVKDKYPAEILVDTPTVLLAKIWTNNAALTLTCSRPDANLTITNAKYM